MSAEAQTDAAQQPVVASQPGVSDAQESTPKRRAARFVVGIILLVLVAVGIGYYLYSRGFEETDDAEVDGHLNPIASRIDGTIKSVLVDDNQAVSAGKLLVELDPRDDQVAMAQAQAQYDQAMAQLGASHPNLPITRISNRSDLATNQAEVAAAEAALASAQHDFDTSVAKLKESQAVYERNQADLARYQTLYEKHEVAPADYDQYKATAAAQAQTVASNQSAVASAQKTVDQRKAQVAEQQSKLQQTQSSGPLQVAIRQADIKSQKANSECRSRRADIQGPAVTHDCANRRPMGNG
jgi:membrane fusion protein (multidrug efflux system)